MKKIVILITVLIVSALCNTELDCFTENQIKQLKLFKPSEVIKIKKYAEKHKCFIYVDPQEYAGCEYETIELSCEQKQFNGLTGDKIFNKIIIRRKKDKSCSMK